MREWRLALTAGQLHWSTSPFISVSGCVLWTWSCRAGNASRDLDHFYILCLLPRALGRDLHWVVGFCRVCVPGFWGGTEQQFRKHSSSNILRTVPVGVLKWFHDLSANDLVDAVLYFQFAGSLLDTKMQPWRNLPFMKVIMLIFFVETLLERCWFNYIIIPDAVQLYWVIMRGL